MDGIFTKVNNLYNKKGFIEKYGTDLWITVIIFFIFFLIMSYYHIINNIQPIIADWDNQKCNPSVIPFVGFINKPPDMGAFEFTGLNFTGCIQTLLKTVVADVFIPIYYMMKIFTDIFNDFNEILNGIRSLFNTLRINIKTFTDDVMNRILNITVPIFQFVINMKDMLSKTNGVLAATLYTFFGVYYTLKSALGAAIEFIVDILWILAIMILALIVISYIPIIGLFAEIAIIPLLVIFILILLPLIAIEGAAFEVLDMSPQIFPDVPGCFSKNTKISKYYNANKNMANKNYVDVNISDIVIGDKLADGSLVTGVIKFSATKQKIFNLYDVIVTGDHRVLHDKLGWIKVKNHPDSRPINDFKEPFVYCLMTDSKTFKIGEIVYSDWDDIDDKVLSDIKNNCKFIPETFKKEDIHYYLDNGVHGDTPIYLEDYNSVKLENIQVNDTLIGGVKVLGKVKIDAINTSGVYKLNNLNKYKCISITSELIGSPNIELHECDLGSYNNSTITDDKIENIPFLYQLITDTGYFYINGLKVKDYNYGIDKYISTNI
jgi:hypothetical protein